jgi:hypothetical protein
MGPDIQIILSSRTPPSNPEQNYGMVAVIAPCSQGPFDTPQLMRSNADLATLGWGPAVNRAAYILARAGGPVQVVRSRSTFAGQLWGLGLVKEPGGQAQLFVYGRVMLPGADANGNLTWQALAGGVSLQCQSGMALGVVVNGKAMLFTIPSGTTATAVASFWSTDTSPSTVQARALATITAEGTGASNAGTTLATASFDDGTIVYTGVDTGYSERQKQLGNGTSLTSSYTGQVLTINLATNTVGTATSTAQAVVGNIAAGALGKFTAIYLGTGLGLAGVQAAPSTIPFGDSGAVTVSGTPYDYANIVVQCLSGGTVGGAPAPVIQWAIDAYRKEDGRTFGRGNGALALIARRGGLKAQLVQQTGTSKGLYAQFDGVTLSIYLGTDGSNNPGSTAVAVQAYLYGNARFRAAFLAYIPSGDGSAVMEPADLVAMTGPSQTWSAPILVPSSGIVALKNSAVDTGLTLTFSGLLDKGDVWAGQCNAPVSSVDDMTSAANALLASATIRPAGVSYGSPISRSQGATVSGTVRGALNTRQVWGLAQGVAWDPEQGTEAAWRDGLVADWLGFVEELMGVCGGEVTMVSAYTGRAQICGTDVVAAGTAALAPYHQDLGKVRPGPTSGSLANVLGVWHDEILDTTLADNRFIATRSDEDAPGQIYFRSSPTMADPSSAGRNRLQFTRTDLVCAREAKLQLRIYRNQALDYQTAAGSDGTPAGALTKASGADVEGALNAVLYKELTRVKADGESSMSPLAPGQKLAVVTRNNDYSTDHTIYAEVGAPKRPPAEKAVLKVYDRPAQAA